MSRTQTPFERLCKRFEIAVGNFGRSCIDMRANEKAFQAWYAACVIQEFGLRRVYREVHLAKPDLFEFAPACSFTAPHKTGNELFPDLSVSWEDVDARSSNTRRSELKHAGAMLMQFGILSELKVTGSTGVATLPQQIERDLSKLAVFAAAHKAAEPALEAPRKRELATYLVVLDNFCGKDAVAKPRFGDDNMDRLLTEVASEWPAGVTTPVVLLHCPAGPASVTRVYRDLKPTESSL
ncbi:MAG: hypothetical protein NTW19_17130 [Planctomycetota bacterium]|nr:hypothetical protein [Planctomycetota bacterium]